LILLVELDILMKNCGWGDLVVKTGIWRDRLTAFDTYRSRSYRSGGQRDNCEHAS